jgi:hypothetical protein
VTRPAKRRREPSLARLTFTVAERTSPVVKTIELLLRRVDWPCAGIDPLPTPTKRLETGSRARFADRRSCKRRRVGTPLSSRGGPVKELRLAASGKWTIPIETACWSMAFRREPRRRKPDLQLVSSSRSAHQWREERALPEERLAAVRPAQTGVQQGPFDTPWPDSRGCGKHASHG